MICDSSNFAILNRFYVQLADVNPLINQSLSVFIRSALITDIKVIGIIFLRAPLRDTVIVDDERADYLAKLVYGSGSRPINEISSSSLSRYECRLISGRPIDLNQFFLDNPQCPRFLDNNLSPFCTISFH